MIDGNLRVLCPFLIFKSEYLFVQSIIDMQEKNDPSMGVVGQIIIPQLSLLAYETSQWMESRIPEKLFPERSYQLLAKKRHLFKYFDDTSYTVDQFEAHCTAVLKASRAMFKQGAGAFSFLQKDSGVYTLDGIEAGSTFTTFRYLYDDLVEDDGSIDYSLINQRAQEIGFLIGEHTSCLVGLMMHFDQDDLAVQYKPPILKEPEDDFYFSSFKATIVAGREGEVSDGLLVILADAYYSLGSNRVFNSCGMMDNLLTVKFNLITLFHLESAIKKVTAFSYRETGTPMVTGAFASDLNALIACDDKRFLRKCRTIRNTLVHYELPENESIMRDPHQTADECILEHLASYANCNWFELSRRVNSIAENVRLSLGKYFVIKD